MKKTLLLALLLASPACEQWGVPIPIDVDLERMIDQRKVEPMEAFPMFPDGRGMRTPPAGTIPVNTIVGRPMVTEGIEGGVYARSFPIKITAPMMAEGKKRFEVVCATCHGVLGDGESIVAENMTLRPAPSLLSDRVRGLPDGHIFEVATKGFGLMPSFRATLTTEQRWGIVAYIRALQMSQGAELAALPPAVRDEATRSLGGTQ